MNYVTVTEAADLTGYNERHIRRLINSNSFVANEQMLQNNRKKYLIDITSLPLAAQKKYFKRVQQRMLSQDQVKTAKEEADKRLDELSAHEREQVALWIEILDLWQTFRRNYIGNKTNGDSSFLRLVEEKYKMDISMTTLYRKFESLKESDFNGLVDKRGAWRRGKTKMPIMLWDAFLYYYLDQRRYSVGKCIEYATEWASEYHPDLLRDPPERSCYYRQLDRECKALITLGRYGEKALQDKHGLYIMREYEEMQANDYWVADTHTLDIMSASDSGKLHRLYMVAIMDVRSGIIVGWNITDRPGSEATRLALRKAIIRHGIPKNLYVDNGREFLTKDLGGLGHRQTKKQKENEELLPTPILARLGITMINAIVRNARAKTIERRFLDFKNEISKLFATYCGGNSAEKPENLKRILKSNKVPTDETLKEDIAVLIDGYFNQSIYNGSVTADKGKPKLQVYYEQLTEKREPNTIEDLNLLLMRSTILQKVSRQGVSVSMFGIKLNYYSETFAAEWQGKQVFVRYDPDDIKECLVYDKDERFVCKLPVNRNVVRVYGEDKEELAEAIRSTRSFEKKIKGMLKDVKSRLPEEEQMDALNLVLEKARSRMNTTYESNPEVITAVSEQGFNDDLGSTATVKIDLRLMAESIRKIKKSEE